MKIRREAKLIVEAKLENLRAKILWKQTQRMRIQSRKEKAKG